MRFTINDAQDIREEAVRDILEERGHTLVKSGEGAEVCLHFSRTDAPGYRAVKDGEDVCIEYHSLPEAFRALGVRDRG